MIFPSTLQNLIFFPKTLDKLLPPSGEIRNFLHPCILLADFRYLRPLLRPTCCLTALAADLEVLHRSRSSGWGPSSPWSRRGQRRGPASSGGSSTCAHDQSIIDLVVGSADEVDLIHIIHSRNDEVEFVLMALEEVNLILVIIYEVDHGFVDVDEVDLV